MRPNILIGIDSGVNTGIAVYARTEKELVTCLSIKIHKAMELVLAMGKLQYPILVRVEDARQRKWFGKAGREQLQGAGSIKRDAKIWEDFLTDHNIPFELVAPKNNKTKIDSATFKKLTGWHLKTNEHSRDAAMLVFGL